MYFHPQVSVLVLIIGTLILYYSVISSTAIVVPFDTNYVVTYGYDHVQFLDQAKSELQMSLDKISGAGFGSKVKYGSGFFKMRLKVPPHDSGGVVTAFYLHSGTAQQDELDFEFLGNREGKPVRLQTNVFTNGVGNREQRIFLWFDPTADYHTYRILWNPHQVVFFVDKIPIRVFKNNRGIGVDYPSQPLQVLASVWDGSDWATDGGHTKVNWSHAPFTAHYTDFDIRGCRGSPADCSGNHPWNREKFWTLNAVQETYYQNTRKNYLYYDYCTDAQKHPVPPPECDTNGRA